MVLFFLELYTLSIIFSMIIHQCWPREKPRDWKSTSITRGQGKTKERDIPLQSGNSQSLPKETSIWGVSWVAKRWSGCPLHLWAGTKELHRTGQDGWGTGAKPAQMRGSVLHACPGLGNGCYRNQHARRHRGAVSLWADLWEAISVLAQI